MATLLSLPPDILRYISELLPIKDLLFLQLVCRFIRRTTRQVYEKRIVSHLETPPIIPEAVITKYLDKRPLHIGHLLNSNDDPREEDYYKGILYRGYTTNCKSKVVYAMSSTMGTDLLNYEVEGYSISRYWISSLYDFLRLDLLTQYNLACHVEPRSIAKRRVLAELVSQYREYMENSEINEIYRFNIFLWINLEDSTKRAYQIHLNPDNRGIEDERSILQLLRENEELYSLLLEKLREL